VTGGKPVSNGLKEKKTNTIKYSKIIQGVDKLSKEDVVGLHTSELSYGDSWKQRGGVGAFMMLARKWDRLEKQVTNHNYDIFESALADFRPEGVLDDIKDLRRYLFLVESEILMQAKAKKLKPHVVGFSNQLWDCDAKGYLTEQKE
jgi:hypothetical protein